VLAHSHDLGDDRIVGPLDTEDLSKLLQILGGCLADRENGVAEPAHAQAAELLVEELYAKLRRKKGNVFDNGQPNTPLLILGKLDYSGEEGLRKELDADDCEMLVQKPTVR
jgi:hypothetical protein